MGTTGERLATRSLARGIVLVCLLAVALVHWALVTQGTGQLDVREPRGGSFDSLARSLLCGRADVDPAAIAWEGFQVGGRTVMYFGPFPALLRILPNAVAPGMSGRWTRPSLLLAGLLSVLGGARIIRRALEQRGGSTDQRLVAAGVVALGLGSPVAFLVSSGIIYHEAMAWGLCGSLWGLSFVRDLFDPQANAARALAGLSASYAVALLSRVTFAPALGLALAALLPIAVLRAVRARSPGLRRHVGMLVLATTPAIAATLFQLWYNQARFGTPWKAISHGQFYIHPERFGGLFNAARLADSLPAYFGTSIAVSSDPPYLEPKTVRYDNPWLFMNWRDQTLSLTAASPWLVVGSLAGLVVFLRRRGSPLEAAQALLLAAQSLVIGSFYFVTQRFLAEFVPLLLFLTASFLARRQGNARSDALLRGGAFALTAVSVFATLLGVLSWNLVYNGDAPADYRARLARLVSRPPALAPWDGPRVPLGDLPIRVLHASSGPPRRYDPGTGPAIGIRGIRYDQAVTMHADTVVRFALPPRCTAFQAILGLPDETNRYWTADVVFEALDAKGALLFRSTPLQNGSRPVPVRIPTTGLSELVLAVRTADGRIDRDDIGVWAAPECLLRKAPEAPPPAD